MTKIQRRLFLLFFVILFIVTAPAVIMFATGYRFDSANNIFVHSGSITIESWPRDVDIYINGKFQDDKKLNNINNSYTINGIRPGKYHIECKKDGYTNWQKNIEVHSGISTEFWNVLLFPTTMAQNVLYNTPTVDQFFLSPRNNDEVVFFSHDGDYRTVNLLNIQDNAFEEVMSTNSLNFLDPSQEENVEWSTDNRKILIPMTEEDNKVYLIARIQKDELNNIINLNEQIQDPTIKLEKVRWMYDKSDELVMLTKNHQLYYYYLNAPEDKILLAENVSAFNFAGNRIYYTQLPNNLVWEIKDNDIISKRQITNMSASSGEQDFIKLIVYDEYRLAIINNKNQLFIFNEEKEKGEKTMIDAGSNVKSIQFSNDGKKMLYWTPNEIWALILRDWDVQPIRRKNDRILVTRFSEPIKNVQWIENYENLIFNVDKYIKDAELDTRDRVNMVDIVSASSSLEERDLFYNKNNQQIFYRNKIGDRYFIKSSLLINKSGLLTF